MSRQNIVGCVISILHDEEPRFTVLDKYVEEGDTLYLCINKKTGDTAHISPRSIDKIW